jgi:hypothetical protein
MPGDHDQGYDGRGRRPFLKRKTPVDRIARWHGRPLPPAVFEAARKAGLETFREWEGRVSIEAVIAAVYLAGVEAAMSSKYEEDGSPSRIIKPRGIV